MTKRRDRNRKGKDHRIRAELKSDPGLEALTELARSSRDPKALQPISRELFSRLGRGA